MNEPTRTNGGIGPLNPEEPVLCDKCGRMVPRGVMIVLQRGGIGSGGPVRFRGCSNCLVKELNELEFIRGPICGLCGSVKVPTQFSGGAHKLECPIHSQARELLSKALSALEGRPPPEDLASRIRMLLGLPVGNPPEEV